MSIHDHPLELILEGVKLSGGNTQLLGTLANKLGEDALGENEVVAIVDEMFSQIDLYSRNNEVVDLCLVVLSNLTVVEGNCEVFLKREVSTDTVSLSDINASKRFSKLIDKFLDHNPQTEDESMNYAIKEAVIEVDPLAHVASIICNICRTDSGRKVIMKVSNEYIPRIASQIRSNNLVRRQGCVGAIRSCLFDSEVHWWMLHEAKILPYILHPLVVATPFDEKDRDGMDPRLWLAAEDKNKKYEPDVGVRKMLLECIILLCQKKPQRDILRKWRVYPVCRNLDLEQEDEGVSEVIYEIVNLLMRDEEGEASAWDMPLRIEDKKEEKKANDATACGEGVFVDMGVD